MAALDAGELVLPKSGNGSNSAGFIYSQSDEIWSPGHTADIFFEVFRT